MADRTPRTAAERAAVRRHMDLRRGQAARYSYPGAADAPWFPSAEDRAEAEEIVRAMRGASRG